MNDNLLSNQQLLRKIFGVCPCCGELFRLSDLEIHEKKMTSKETRGGKKKDFDWLERIELLEEKADNLETRIEERESGVREAAREAGRKAAEKAMELAIRKVDSVFTPAKLDARDSKVIFHPIDFVVFNGLQHRNIDKIMMLDRKPQNKAHDELQKKIISVVKRKAFEWRTIHVAEDGLVSSK